MRGKGKYRKGVFIVVYRKERKKGKKEGGKIFYLILRRKLHWKGWEFPKGGVEKETTLKAVKREGREETGQSALNIKKFSLAGKYKYDKRYSDRAGFIGQSWHLYSAEIKNKKIKLDKKEHSAYKWLAYKKALKLLRWRNQKKCLRVVDKALTKL